MEEEGEGEGEKVEEEEGEVMKCVRSQGDIERSLSVLFLFHPSPPISLLGRHTTSPPLPHPHPPLPGCLVAPHESRVSPNPTVITPECHGSFPSGWKQRKEVEEKDRADGGRRGGRKKETCRALEQE